MTDQYVPDGPVAKVIALRLLSRKEFEATEVWKLRAFCNDLAGFLRNAEETLTQYGIEPWSTDV